MKPSRAVVHKHEAMVECSRKERRRQQKVLKPADAHFQYRNVVDFLPVPVAQKKKQEAKA